MEILDSACSLWLRKVGGEKRGTGRGADENRASLSSEPVVWYLGYWMLRSKGLTRAQLWSPDARIDRKAGSTYSNIREVEREGSVELNVQCALLAEF